MPFPDLITSQYATTFLSLSAADQTRLPGIITAASRLVRNYCGRIFTLRPSEDGTLGPIDELVTAPPRGEILLREYPIQDVYRVSSSKTPIFSVVNRDTTDNQRAVARLTRTGDEAAGYTTSGLYLEWWTSGVRNNTTILFSSLPAPTIQALAQAVQAIGSGWDAWPSNGQAGDSDDYSLWPVSELRPGQGALGALDDAAEFEAWVDDVDTERDDEAGMLTVVNTQDNPFTSLRFGPMAGLQFGDEQIRGQHDGVRVVYSAGYADIPDDLQQAVVEVAKAMLERKNVSYTIAKERTDTWSVEVREVLDAIPDGARQTLALYRSNAR